MTRLDELRNLRKTLAAIEENTRETHAQGPKELTQKRINLKIMQTLGIACDIITGEPTA